MAYEIPAHNITLPAAAALNQFTFVDVNSSGQASTPSAGAKAVGVAQSAADAAGKAVPVTVFGVTKVVAGGTVTAGSLAAVGSGGKAVNAASTNTAVGVFLTGGSSDNIVTMLVVPAVGRTL